MLKMKIADEDGDDAEEQGTVFQLACCCPAEHELQDNTEGYLAACVDGKSLVHKAEAAIDNASFTKQVLPLLLKHCFPTSESPFHSHAAIIEYVRRKSDTLQVSALWWACMYGNLEAVNFLIAERLLENDETKFLETDCALQRTPLWISCCNGHVDVVRFLIKTGVNPSAEEQHNIRHCSPFAVACAFARLEVMRELLPLIKHALTDQDWVAALLKVTCLVPVEHEKLVWNFEDLDCVSSIYRSSCIELLLHSCERPEPLKYKIRHSILPILRDAPSPFRGRNVEYNEFPQWSLKLTNWLENPQGQKRKASDLMQCVEA